MSKYKSYVDNKAFKRDLQKLQDGVDIAAKKALDLAYDRVELYKMSFDETEVIPATSKKAIIVTISSDKADDEVLEDASQLLAEAADIAQQSLEEDVRRLLR